MGVIKVLWSTPTCILPHRGGGWDYWLTFNWHYLENPLAFKATEDSVSPLFDQNECGK